jgi:FKBP-type peptidyl-prolyl cis-trans isomerase FkpA
MKHLIVLASVAALACGDSVSGPPEEVEFAPELGVDLATMEQTPNGVYYLDLEVGTGDTVVAGILVRAEYTGWLIDGTVFDDSEFCFPLTGVIGGWQEGIPGMLVGGKRKLVIPPNMAYGDRGSGSTIPGNATLVFDIRIHEINCTP